MVAGHGAAPSRGCGRGCLQPVEGWEGVQALKATTVVFMWVSSEALPGWSVNGKWCYQAPERQGGQGR